MVVVTDYGTVVNSDSSRPCLFLLFQDDPLMVISNSDPIPTLPSALTSSQIPSLVGLLHSFPFNLCLSPPTPASPSREPPPRLSSTFPLFISLVPPLPVFTVPWNRLPPRGITTDFSSCRRTSQKELCHRRGQKGKVAQSLSWPLKSELLVAERHNSEEERTHTEGWN